ncbi:MAG: trigger factor [Candidatus Cloacimonetes bacterium]|nr:trigger factor [Candidatus Cloacimonadota bacterium]
MKTEIKEISQCVRDLVITVDADRAKQDYSGILRSLRPMAMVPGFRKGKAPLPMIENMYGEHAREEFFRQKLAVYFEEAATDLDPAPLNQPEATDVQWKKGDDLVAIFRYEVKPQLGEIVCKDLEVRFLPQELSDEAVTEAIEGVRTRMGNLTEVSEPVQAADHVNIALQLPKEGGEWSDQVEREVVAGENQFSPAFNEALLGKQAGDVFEVSLFEPHAEGEDAPPPARIEVKSVKRNFLPDLDDEFAKDVEYDSMDDMRAKVREELEKNLAQENRRGEKQAITDALIAANPFEAPPSLTYQVAGNMAEEFAKQYNIPAEQILPAYEKIAERDLKQYYIVERLKQLEEHAVSDDDRERMVEELAANMNMSVEEYRDKYAKFIEADDFTQAIIEKMIYALIRDTSHFVAPEPPADAEEK